MIFSHIFSIKFTLALAILISLNARADLQLGPDLEPCKKTIKENFEVARSFRKDFDIEGTIKNTSGADRKEALRREPIWQKMKSIGASEAEYSKMMNNLGACEDVKIFFDRFEDSIN